jgi:hypothetical protein
MTSIPPKTISVTEAQSLYDHVFAYEIEQSGRRHQMKQLSVATSFEDEYGEIFLVLAETD